MPVPPNCTPDGATAAGAAFSTRVADVGSLSLLVAATTGAAGENVKLGSSSDSTYIARAHTSYTRAGVRTQRPPHNHAPTITHRSDHTHSARDPWCHNSALPARARRPQRRRTQSVPFRSACHSLMVPFASALPIDRAASASAWSASVVCTQLRSPNGDGHVWSAACDSVPCLVACACHAPIEPGRMRLG
jgi:hypothetical protein